MANTHSPSYPTTDQPEFLQSREEQDQTDAADLLKAIQGQAHYTSESFPCMWASSNPEHADCMIQDYYVSMIMTIGSDKSHRMAFTNHSSQPNSTYASNSPACGSKRWGAPTIRNMVEGRPTCGRC
jgi:hypothetical protein